MSIEEIAEMLEEESSAIAPIYDLIQSHPDWEDERICGGLAGRKDNVEIKNS